MTISSFLENVIKIVDRYGFLFIEGTLITIVLSLVTVVFGVIVAVVILLMKKSGIKVLSTIAQTYIEIIRGVPLLLLLYVIYVLSPNSWPPFLSIVVALIINSGAYVSEIIRAGIEAVDKGQYEACRSLGLSKFQAMKQVIMPQAIKKILPALGNEFVMLIKETSLASVFFVGDLMTIVVNIRSITYLAIEPLFVSAIIYFTLTFSASKLIKHFEMKMEA